MTKLLRCATLEQCRQIQKGSILFRRLSRWIALCSIGITWSISYWISHFQTRAEDYINKYDRVAKSRPVKWLYDAPSTEWIRELIRYYNAIDRIQTFILVGMAVYAVRWVYADSVVREIGARGFWRELGLILLVNWVVYLIFSSRWFFHLLAGA